MSAVQRLDLHTVDVNVSRFGLQQSQEQLQGDAFSGSAAAHDAASLAAGHIEGDLVQNRPRERFRNFVEANRRRTHKAPAGNNRKMILTNRTLMTISTIDENTTLRVDARPIPSEPPVAV